MKRTSLLALSLCFLLLAGAAQAAAKKPWTFLVYMNAKNNLEPYGLKNLQQMTRVGSTDQYNLVVLWAPKSGSPSLYYVEKGGLRTLKTPGSLNMGDIKTFVAFAKENIAAFPADHYYLEIWSHGQGWRHAARGPAVRSVSGDESTGSTMTIDDLGRGLAEIRAFLGRKPDVLAFDACYMQMVEMACPLRDQVDYLLASEEGVPGDGFPYDWNLADFRPEPDPTVLFRGWVDNYARYYATTGNKTVPATLSLLDCSRLAEFQSALEAFARLVIEGRFTQEINTALSRTQRFKNTDHKDLGDFLANLRKGVGDPRLIQAITVVEAAYARAVVHSNFNPTFMKIATGMSVYFPEKMAFYERSYDACAHSRASNWDEMLRTHLARSTVAEIVDEALAGDLGGLRAFVAENAGRDSTLARELVESLNFAAFVDHGLQGQAAREISGLLGRLRADPRGE